MTSNDASAKVPRRSRGGLLLVALALFASSAALAEEAPGPTAPAPRGDTAVPYPAGARGDADVVLEIVVDKDGTVSDATVLEGEEPFAAQARSAVLGWRFVPALRGDSPVAARIRVGVEFREEHAPAADAGAPAPAPPPPPVVRAPAPAPVTEPALEVTVQGRRGEAGNDDAVRRGGARAARRVRRSVPGRRGAAQRHADPERAALLLHPRRAAQRQRVLRRRRPRAAAVPPGHRPGRHPPRPGGAGRLLPRRRAGGYRDPSFVRLDLRVEKRWPLGKGGSLALVIEGQNVTLSKETTSFGQDCMGEPGLPTQCTPTRTSIGPITIPSVGVEGFF